MSADRGNYATVIFGRIGTRLRMRYRPAIGTSLRMAAPARNHSERAPVNTRSRVMEPVMRNQAAVAHSPEIYQPVSMAEGTASISPATRWGAISSR